jgi:hypothetical protein
MIIPSQAYGQHGLTDSYHPFEETPESNGLTDPSHIALWLFFTFLTLPVFHYLMIQELSIPKKQLIVEWCGSRITKMQGLRGFLLVYDSGWQEVLELDLGIQLIAFFLC